MLEQGSPVSVRPLFPWGSPTSEGHANAPDPDATGVDRLFARIETAHADSRCRDAAETLAGDLFRFMMLDENLLVHAFVRACPFDSRP
ncbi:MAG: hypothetical protein WB440_14480 [Steroidobacteraceae bacterium]|jgi:hypothetical protein